MDRWAAFVSAPGGDDPAIFGACAEEKVIPASYRRRMGPMDRATARCVLGVLADAGEAEIVYASRYGNFDALVSLLRSLTEREPLSPMTFSLSVHNALAGMLGQIRIDRSAHTAVAACRGTLVAGLIEAYCRLQLETARPVALVFSGTPLPEPYATFTDEEPVTIALVLLLAAGDAGATTSLPAVTLSLLATDPSLATLDGSNRLARQMITHLSDRTPLAFRPLNGPAWRLGPSIGLA